MVTVRCLVLSRIGITFMGRGVLICMSSKAFTVRTVLSTDTLRASTFKFRADYM